MRRLDSGLRRNDAQGFHPPSQEATVSRRWRNAGVPRSLGEGGLELRRVTPYRRCHGLLPVGLHILVGELKLTALGSTRQEEERRPRHSPQDSRAPSRRWRYYGGWNELPRDSAWLPHRCPARLSSVARLARKVDKRAELHFSNGLVNREIRRGTCLRCNCSTVR